MIPRKNKWIERRETNMNEKNGNGFPSGGTILKWFAYIMGALILVSIIGSSLYTPEPETEYAHIEQNYDFSENSIQNDALLLFKQNFTGGYVELDSVNKVFKFTITDENIIMSLATMILSPSPESDADWAGLVSNYVIISKELSKKLPGYGISLTDPYKTDISILTIRDGVVIYNYFAKHKKKQPQSSNLTEREISGIEESIDENVSENRFKSEQIPQQNEDKTVHTDPEKPVDQEKQKKKPSKKDIQYSVLSILRENFDGLANVEFDRDKKTFKVIFTDEDIVSTLSTIFENKDDLSTELTEAWDDMVENFLSLSETITETLPGYELWLMDPENTDSPRLMTMNGMVLYTFVKK